MKKNSKIIIIGALILAFRIGYRMKCPVDVQVQPDSKVYMRMAENIASGGGYHAGKYYSIRPPLYPLFMGSVFKIFGKSVLAIQIIQIILSLFSGWFIFKIAENYFDSDVGMIAALLYAVSYDSFAPPVWLTSECLYIFFITAAIYFIVAGRYVYSGLLLGLAYLTRQESLLFALIAPFFIYMKTKNVKYGVKFILPVLFLMFVWGVRNYQIHGKYFTGTTLTYRHLYAANEYVFERLGGETLDVDIDNIPGNLSELNEEKVRRQWCVKLFRKQPLRNIILAPVVKLAFFIYPFLPEFDVTFVLIFPFWIGGMYLYRKRILDFWPLYGIFVILIGLICVFHAIPRYRMAFDPFIIIFSAAALVKLWSSCKKWKSAAAGWFFFCGTVWIFSESIRTSVKAFLG